MLVSILPLLTRSAKGDEKDRDGCGLFELPNASRDTADLAHYNNSDDEEYDAEYALLELAFLLLFLFFFFRFFFFENVSFLS
jgi:hypothetical protein